MTKQSHIAYVPPELLKWRYKALCRHMDPDIFFPKTDDEQQMVAQSICSECSVQEDCLAYAIIYKQDDGVWGATSKERRRMRKKNRAYLNNLIEKFTSSS